jgi:hypothetical protein
MRLLRAETSV